MINNLRKCQKLTRFYLYTLPFGLLLSLRWDGLVHLRTVSDSVVHFGRSSAIVCGPSQSSWEISSFKPNKQDYEYICVQIKIEVLNILCSFFTLYWPVDQPS